MRQIKKENATSPTDESQESGIPEKVSRMAIGVEGGFQAADFKTDEYDDINDIVIIPSFQRFGVDDQVVPLAIQMSAKAVIQAQSAIHKAEIGTSSMFSLYLEGNSAVYLYIRIITAILRTFLKI